MSLPQVHCISREVLLKACQTANSSSTIEFIKHLQAQNRETKLVLVWDAGKTHLIFTMLTE